LKHVERNEVDVAWAAGLFEGEGCWSMYVRKSGKRQIHAAIGMTDQDVIERLASIIGFGTVRRSHSAVHVARGDKPLFIWGVYEAERIRELIALFLPYLCARRHAKALEVLDFGRDIRSHNSKATHCPQKHPLSGGNLQLEPFKHPNGKEYVARRCRKCRTEQSRARARQKLGITPDRYRTKEI
jgi:hypothetical protein